MAKRSFSEEDFSCPVCYNIYKEPVLLTLCSHSICKACLELFWKTKKSRECPICRKRCPREVNPLNLVLKNLCEIYQQEKNNREQVCNLHCSDLKLFCEDDKQLVCLVCRDSKLHKNHNFSPINEAAQEYKAGLGTEVMLLNVKLAVLEEEKVTCEEIAQHIQVQAQHTERLIREEFEQLHQFLRDEEEERIAALREEEKQKGQMMKVRIENMTREIAALSEKISTIEEEMGADNILFLQNYKSTLERTQYTLQDPERVTGTLINVAQHLGNLKFRICEEMQRIAPYTPVILDPNTAFPSLILSDDLTVVKDSDEWQQLPENPERFDSWINIVGSEGFNSGPHYWDVEVGENREWDVGVMSESAKRKGEINSGCGIWYMLHVGGEYFTVSTPQQKSLLKLSQKPKRIRVHLDWDKGMVSFFDPDNDTHLHTFTHTFTERVFPFFGSQCTDVPLRILPLNGVVEEFMTP